MVELSSGSTRIYGEAAFEVLAKAQNLEKQGKKILHFEIGEPDFETPENIVEILQHERAEANIGEES